jgi:hypothetical protein
VAAGLEQVLAAAARIRVARGQAAQPRLIPERRPLERPPERPAQAVRQVLPALA